MAGFSGFFFWLLKDVGLTGWDVVRGSCRDAGKRNECFYVAGLETNLRLSIVEYATREQAQQAVNTLSNQNLMGRLVYVREVGSTLLVNLNMRPKLRQILGSRSRTPFHRTSSWRSRRIRRWTSWWIWWWIWGWRNGCRRWWRWSSNLRLQRLFPIHFSLLSICVELSC